MPIIEALQKKYPVTPYLTIPELNANLEFEYETENVLTEQFKAGLEDLGIGIGTIQSFFDPIKIVVTSENRMPLFRINDEKICRFPGKEPLNAMLWTAYSLAAQNSWLPDSSDINVLFIGFNVCSQRVAAAILNDVQTKLSIVPNVRSIIEPAVKEYAQRFIDEAPTFIGQPVTEAGMALVASSGGLLKKASTALLDDLADSLYGGSKNFREELEAYCDFLRNASPKYKKAISNALEQCRERLLANSMHHLEDSIENTKIELLSRYNAQEKIRNAESSLRETKTYKNLKPETIEFCFSSVTGNFALAAKDKITSLFIEDFASAAKEDVSKSAKEALNKLKVINAELRNFCRLSPSDFDVNLKWDEDGNVDIAQLHVQDATWRAEDISAIQMNAFVPTGYFDKRWYAGDLVAGPAVQAGITQLDSVYSLDNRYLCALCFKDNSTGERI